MQLNIKLLEAEFSELQILRHADTARFHILHSPEVGKPHASAENHSTNAESGEFDIDAVELSALNIPKWSSIEIFRIHQVTTIEIFRIHQVTT
jgi:hypothetical protein